MKDQNNREYIKDYSYNSVQQPDAVVLLVHGLGEHAGRYTGWAKQFNDTGVEMRSFDLPGHGLSGGRRGVVPPFDVLHDIIDSKLESIAADRPGIPLFLYGHSLGGGIVLDYLVRRKTSLTGAIVTSPWITLTMTPPRLKVMMAVALKSIVPDMTSSSGLNAGYLSRDSQVVTAYVADPLVHDRISFRLFTEALKASEEILAGASGISLPVLVIHGRSDMITSPSGSVEVASSMPSSILKLWDDGYHELHNEPFRDDHFTFIREWIDTLI